MGPGTEKGLYFRI